MTYPQQPYGQQFPPFGGQVPPAPAPMPYGQPPYAPKPPNAVIGGLIAAGREKRTPPRFPETGDIVLDTMARLRVFTPADEQRMNAMVDAEEKGQPFPPPQYPQGY